MSGRRHSAIVTRVYKNSPDECAHALEVLLKKKAVGVTSTNGDDVVRKGLDAHTTTPSIR